MRGVVEVPPTRSRSVRDGASGVAAAARRALPGIAPPALAFLAGMLGPLVGLVNGGFDVSASAPLAALSLVAAAIVVALAPAAVPRSAPALLAILGVAGLAVVTAVSLGWSPMVDFGWLSATKAIGYAAVFVIAAVTIRTSTAAFAAVGGLVAGAGLLALVSVIQLVGADDPTGRFWSGRLAGPVGYQNGFALILFAGTLAALGVATMSARSPWGVARRTAAYLVIGLTVSAGVASQSRGAALGAAIGLIALVALARHRTRLVPALAGVALATVITLQPAIDLREGVEAGPAPAAAAAGDWAARVWPAVVLVTVLGLAYGVLEATIGRRRSVRRWSRRAAIGASSLAVIAGAVLLALNAGAIAERASEPLTTGLGAETRTGERFVSLSSNTRSALWEQAAAAMADRPALGQGAGGFFIWWNVERDETTDSLFAHSIFMEVGSETGAVGLALLAAWLAGVVWMAVRVLRRRRVRRLPAAVLIAVALAWVAAASFDWHWYLPAATIPALVAMGALVGLGGAGHRSAGADWRARARIAIAAAAVAVAAVGVVFVGRPFLADRHVDAAARIGVNDPEAARERLDRAEGLNRWDHRIDELRARISLGTEDVARARRELVEGTRRLPLFYLTWKRLADLDEHVRDDPRRALAEARRAWALHSRDSGLGDQVRRLQKRLEDEARRP